jgi:hypothetical protein
MIEWQKTQSLHKIPKALHWFFDGKKASYTNWRANSYDCSFVHVVFCVFIIYLVIIDSESDEFLRPLFEVIINYLQFDCFNDILK